MKPSPEQKEVLDRALRIIERAGSASMDLTPEEATVIMDAIAIREEIGPDDDEGESAYPIREVPPAGWCAGDYGPYGREEDARCYAYLRSGAEQ